MPGFDFSHIPKIWIRLFVIYMINLMIKAFDLSFGGFLDFTFRGIVFSVFFMGFWLSVWYLADKLESWLRRHSFKGVIEILFHLVLSYTASLSFNMSYRIWDTYFYNNGAEWDRNHLLNPELTVSLTLLYVLIYISNQYYRSSLSERDKRLKLETMEKETAIAQYSALRSQIEPHFLFNSLSVLSGIVYKDADLANKYIIKLSRTLRYVIEKNEHSLVKLQEELLIVRDFMFLLQVRFDEAIIFSNKIPRSKQSTYSIPPVSIQLLIENAVNHNSFSPLDPMEITIELIEDTLQVSNTLKQRVNTKATTGLGLKNLSRRYKLISGKDIKIKDDGKTFTVWLPLLTSEYNTSSIKKPIQ